MRETGHTIGQPSPDQGFQIPDLESEKTRESSLSYIQSGYYLRILMKNL